MTWLVSGCGWEGSMQQWILSLIVVFPSGNSKTADLSWVFGLIARTLAGSVKDLSLLALPEVYFWVRTLCPTTNLSGFLMCFPLFEFLLTCSSALSCSCCLPCSTSLPCAGRQGMSGCLLSGRWEFTCSAWHGIQDFPSGPGFTFWGPTFIV